MSKIGIITSGGDCGGLNGVVKGAALMAAAMNIEAVIIPNGYAGLYNLINFDELVSLSAQRTDLVNASLAGSEAGHSRVKISKIKDEKKYDRIKEGLKKHGIDGLVISGGDDTGSVIVDLHNNGIPCVHAPKTMDLDLQTYSVGGDSTINRIAHFVSDLKTTGITHNRIMVTEVFGRYAGHTAFRGGVTAEADCILIPEIPVDFDFVYKHLKFRYMRRVSKSDVHAGTYTIVVAEGITDSKGEVITDDNAGVDAFGHKKLAGAGKFVCKMLTQRLKADPEIKDFMKEQHLFVEGLYEVPEVRDVNPGHLVRCGTASAYDVNFGKEAGAGAVRLLAKGLTGVTVVKVVGKHVSYMETHEAIKQRHVDLEQVALYEALGVCFGRVPVDYNPDFIRATGAIDRIY
ncbi:MAG: 6-phosphofructokinase [Candidatus Omnitrophica bacterium]|nr:6-phosphofructokinase [Candidatus Omnitrophota bacterium]